MDSLQHFCFLKRSSLKAINPPKSPYSYPYPHTQQLTHTDLLPRTPPCFGTRLPNPLPPTPPYHLLLLFTLHPLHPNPPPHPPTLPIPLPLRQHLLCNNTPKPQSQHARLPLRPHNLPRPEPLPLHPFLLYHYPNPNSSHPTNLPHLHPNKTSAKQTLSALQHLHPKARPPLRVDQQLRRPEQLPLLPGADVFHLHPLSLRVISRLSGFVVATPTQPLPQPARE